VGAMTSRSGAFAVLAVAAVVLAGCPKKPSPVAEDGGAGDANAASDAGDGGGSSGEERVDSVYPVDPAAPADPLAQKLCAGLHDLPEKKRAACCKQAPSTVVTAECVRQLSAGLRSKALALEPADVDACIAAFDKTLDGCDWVGPFPPGPPVACEAIFKGHVKAGQPCRSSLECEATLRCHGAGPTQAGRCGQPKADGDLCGGATDSLATYTRQSDVDKSHPECKERCVRHKCAPALADGASCQTTADCQTGLLCMPVAGPAKAGLAPRKCAAASLPAKEGDACPSGDCGEGLQCTRGKCATRKGEGEACQTDFDCRGGCLKDGGTKGTCGPRCDTR
jgi:hypothetical protein